MVETRAVTAETKPVVVAVVAATGVIHTERRDLAASNCGLWTSHDILAVSVYSESTSWVCYD